MKKRGLGILMTSFKKAIFYNLKAEINKLKSTDVFKELEEYVSEFTGT